MAIQAYDETGEITLERVPNTDGAGRAINPFESDKRPTSAIAASVSQREVSEVQAALVIARQFPRDQRVSVDRIINAFSRQHLAEIAQYQYARGGTDIKGPSIRAAEAIAQNWGNFEFGWRVVDSNERKSTIQCFSWDYETNTRSVRVYDQVHERHTRTSRTMLTDPRDVYENMANFASRRVRSLILALIPGDVVDTAMAQAEATMRAKVDVGPESLKKLVEAFSAFGVSQIAIEKRIQRRLDTMTPALYLGMRRIYNSLKDGMSQPSDYFELEPTIDVDASKSTTTAGRLANIAANAAQKPAEQATPVAVVDVVAPADSHVADATSDPDFKKMKDAEVVDFLESTAQNIAMAGADFSAIVKDFGGKITKANAGGIYGRLKAYKAPAADGSAQGSLL